MYELPLEAESIQYPPSRYPKISDKLIAGIPAELGAVASKAIGDEIISSIATSPSREDAVIMGQAVASGLIRKATRMQIGVYGHIVGEDQV